MKAWFSGLWGNQQAVVEPATLRDATALCQIHSASFHRGWGESEFETMLTERNTLVDRLRMRRKTIGFSVSRMGADASFPVALPACAALEAATIGLIRDQLVEHGIATEAEVERHLAAVRSGALDLTQPPMVACWGRRPW